MKSVIFALLVFSSSLGFAAKSSTSVICGQLTKAISQGNADAKLKSFLNVEWKYLMTENPEWATYVGYPGLNDRWSDLSMATIERHKIENKCALAVLKKLSRSSLSEKQRINYDLATHDLSQAIEADQFADVFIPVNQMSGIQTDAADLLSAMPAANKADFENMITRLEKLPVLIQQNEMLMREGIKRGVSTNKMFMPRVSAQIDSLTTEKVQESPLYKPFQDMGTEIPADVKTALQARAQEVIQLKVYPAFKQLKKYIDTEYTPNARSTIAWSDLPNGKAWYAFQVKHHTTTTMTPDQLHELGIKEVDRITAAMNKIREQVKFKGDLKAFNKFLLTDKQFYFTSKEDLLTAFRDIAKRIDPELTKMFRTLPRLTYGVREIPSFRAASAAGADYQSGSLEAGRPGWFQANTFDLPSRPKWEMETLTFHEGVPGHHFQISIAQELEGLPEFRKFGGNTAFAEGWALYAESLGEEMGFYKDPYQLFGHYSDEILRAVRLVVDTGMHAKGWSKQQALDYYRSKMPTSDVDSENEINRYIVWPGQALAYKVGQLKFRELRDKSKLALGDKFDVRNFHDVVLGQGALPLDVLEKHVDEWVDTQKKTKVKSKSQTL